MNTYWWRGGMAPSIPNLGARWRWAVSFIPRLLYPQEKSPRYSLDWRLDGPQSRSRRGGEEKGPFPIPAGNRIPVVQPVSLVTILTELLQS